MLNTTFPVIINQNQIRVAEIVALQVWQRDACENVTCIVLHHLNYLNRIKGISEKARLNFQIMDAKKFYFALSIIVNVGLVLGQNGCKAGSSPIQTEQHHWTPEGK